MQSWDAVEEAVSQIVAASSEPFAVATVKNVKNLIELCREFCAIPEGVAKGYWSTINIWWDNRAVEIFDDHYEFYRFEQGHTDIKHFDQTTETIVPIELMDHLPKRPELRD